ncbi:MAG: hypothetical protein C4520_12030 [Candidatus Abyssobacteria bacterium SURF_5]|uniref:Uncharacterized protein n=1 Tax=Abyssobacteria bacterium (strain SURF_5) TaxID=2093360 RepID=A0A3A4NRV9_ABYX5|nr:MAG: hypothetical protein C4520_12030 [Candidatus Abyssubacteria bacterium SURF_5]
MKRESVLFQFVLLPLTLLLSVATACSNLTGWRIPGTEKGAAATTAVYLVLENVETLPEETRTLGEIYVDDAFFGYTSRPKYSRYVGNEMVVGSVQIQREKVHTISVRFPSYLPFETTRYFGTLPEYSVTFSLRKDMAAEPEEPQESDAPVEAVQEKKWYHLW